MKQDGCSPQTGVVRRNKLKLADIVLASIAFAHVLSGAPPDGSPARTRAVVSVPASVQLATDLVVDDLEGTNSVVGVVLALDDKQIGLLQFAEDGTNHQVVVYNYYAATAMPTGSPLASGETVTIEFFPLPDEPPLATSVQRLTADDGTTAPTAAPETVVTVESVPPPAVIKSQDTAEAPPQSTPDSAIYENSVSAELVTEESYPPCPADRRDSENSERFTFGKVVQVLTKALLIREYDFARDADIEVRYELQRATEYGNLTPEQPLQAGDDVVLDYLERDGRRLVTTLVREEKLEKQAGESSYPSQGK